MTWNALQLDGTGKILESLIPPSKTPYFNQEIIVVGSGLLSRDMFNVRKVNYRFLKEDKRMAVFRDCRVVCNVCNWLVFRTQWQFLVVQLVLNTFCVKKDFKFRLGIKLNDSRQQLVNKATIKNMCGSEKNTGVHDCPMVHAY